MWKKTPSESVFKINKTLKIESNCMEKVLLYFLVSVVLWPFTSNCEAKERPSLNVSGINERALLKKYIWWFCVIRRQYVSQGLMRIMCKFILKKVCRIKD